MPRTNQRRQAQPFCLPLAQNMGTATALHESRRMDSETFTRRCAAVLVISQPEGRVHAEKAEIGRGKSKFGKLTRLCDENLDKLDHARFILGYSGSDQAWNLIWSQMSEGKRGYGVRRHEAVEEEVMFARCPGSSEHPNHPISPRGFERMQLRPGGQHELANASKD
ncbi:hypothetical protein Micbo1qcDRAFT_10659 [Microdochium bolleyi]|uniref:Uncharacterized protein n=1 Tax=Microdochium bolleyi TaxID=196109 RepID=A0A136IXW9_9PEZI|nr:hypothetical protein Micbo1qcDRAFT_10659 [Microdochium bolleyi]